MRARRPPVIFRTAGTAHRDARRSSAVRLRRMTIRRESPAARPLRLRSRSPQAHRSSSATTGLRLRRRLLIRLRRPSQPRRPSHSRQLLEEDSKSRRLSGEKEAGEPFFVREERAPPARLQPEALSNHLILPAQGRPSYPTLGEHEKRRLFGGRVAVPLSVKGQRTET